MRYKYFESTSYRREVEDEINEYLEELAGDNQAVVRINSGRMGANNEHRWVEIWSAPKADAPPNNLQF